MWCFPSPSWRLRQSDGALLGCDVSARSLVGSGLGLTERVGVAGNAHGRIVQGSDGLHLIRVQLESEDIQVLSLAFSVSMCR